MYCDGDNRTFTRTAAYTVVASGGMPVTITASDPASTNFSGAFVPSRHYVTFSVHGPAFTLTATPLTGSNTTLRAPVNGIQVVPRQ